MEYHDRFRCHSVKSGVALSKQGSLRRRIQLATDQRIDGVDYLVIELATADTISVTISHIQVGNPHRINGRCRGLEVYVSYRHLTSSLSYALPYGVADAVTSTAYRYNSKKQRKFELPSSELRLC